jgi:hypothetical protein
VAGSGRSIWWSNRLEFFSRLPMRHLTNWMFEKPRILLAHDKLPRVRHSIQKNQVSQGSMEWWRVETMFSSVRAVRGLPFPGLRSEEPVSFTFFTILCTAQQSRTNSCQETHERFDKRSNLFLCRPLRSHACPSQREA